MANLDFDKPKPPTAKPLSIVSADSGLPARTPPPGQDNNAATVRRVADVGKVKQ